MFTAIRVLFTILLHILCRLDAHIIVSKMYTHSQSQSHTLHLYLSVSLWGLQTGTNAVCWRMSNGRSGSVCFFLCVCSRSFFYPLVFSTEPHIIIILPARFFRWLLVCHFGGGVILCEISRNDKKNAE